MLIAIQYQHSLFSSWLSAKATFTSCTTSIPTFKNGQMHTPQTIHLYGHIHQGRDTRPFEQYAKVWEKEMGLTFKAANVGCMVDYMDYTPRMLEEIKKAKGWD